MIIKGNPAGSVKFWAKHLLRDDTNEIAEVKEIRGLLSEDLPSALREMQAVASGSRCHGNFMYQANINPQADEHLTDEQWKEAVDTLERNLGLEDHQRIVVEHIKNGRQHYHIIWNRVDVYTMRVADMGGNWPIHEATARELESKFDLTPTPSHTPDSKPAAELYEIRAADRSGIDPAALKTELTELWQQAEDGKAFQAAIEERGYILAKGDRRDFCVVDQAGDAHSLARRLDGVNTKELRAYMADIDRDTLLSVAEARQAQHDRSIPVRQDATIHQADNDNHQPDRHEQRHAERATDAWEIHADTGNHQIDPIDLRDIAKGQALIVVDVATGVADTLCDFVDGLFSNPPRQPDFTTASQLEELQAQRKAVAALESIRESMERGEGLRSSDIANLTPTHLENIKRHGDAYLRSIIEAQERSNPLQLDYGRAREA